MTAPLIIVEGPDGAGKSTLIQGLGREWRATHFGPYPGEAKIFHHYLNALAKVAKARQPQVFDRSWFSEHVYGQVLRKHDRLGYVRSRMLERVALGLNGVIILCLPAWEVVLKNFERTRATQLPQRLTDLGKIHAWYRWQLKTRVANPYAGLGVVVHDYTADDPLVTLQRALALSEQTRNRGPGIGTFRPGGTLIVGDQVSSRAPHRERSWPFVLETGCSPWLTEQLGALDVPEGRLYWVNARDHRGRLTSARAWVDVLAPARVLALGAQAQQWCRTLLPADAPVHALKHPQYVKRFKHHRPWQELRTVFA